MKKGLVVILILLFAGCSCRTHSSHDMRAMLAPDNVAEETAGPLQRVQFAFDSAILTNESKSIIRDNLELLKQYRNPKVELGGNCDERGTNEYNMVLGMQRAHATFNYISSLGEDSQNFKTVSYGEELPIDPAHNESAWAKNRCVVFNIK